MIRCYQHKDLGNEDKNHNPTKVEVGDYFSNNNEFCKFLSVTDVYVDVSAVLAPESKGVTQKLSFNDPKLSKFIAEI
jgi:hypothetical protein